MIDFITSKLIPDSHPILQYNEKYRDEYVRILGQLLSFFMPEDAKAKLVFGLLCSALSNITVDEVWNNADQIDSYPQEETTADEIALFNQLRHLGFLRNSKKEDITNHKRLLYLKREGFRIHRMSNCFWWDFYRICKWVGFPIEDRFYGRILEQIIKGSSRKYIAEAKAFFDGKNNGVLFPNELKEAVRDEKKFKGNGFIRVLIVGTMSSGKSTLINALTGHNIAKVKSMVCTSSISYYCNTPEKKHIIYANDENCVVSKKIEPTSIEYTKVAVHFDGELQNQPIIFMDTPGVNYAYDKSHKEITMRALTGGDYDVVICVINSGYMESEDSDLLVNAIAKIKHKKIIFVLNQLDLFNEDDDPIDEFIFSFKSRIKELNIKAEVVPFSAKAAYLLKKHFNKNQLSNMENIELKAYQRKINTPYYDFGQYYSGVPSKDNDYKTRIGLTFLENIIKQR